jgi:hypothetical protein
VGSVSEGGADVVDGGLSGFDVEGSGFEEDIGAGCGEPLFHVCWLRLCFPAISGQECPLHAIVRIQAVRVRDPAQAAGGDSGDAIGDVVSLAELMLAVFEQANKRTVYVAEAEEAEVVSLDGSPLADGYFVETLLATSLSRAPQTAGFTVPLAET